MYLSLCACVYVCKCARESCLRWKPWVPHLTCGNFALLITSSFQSGCTCSRQMAAANEHSYSACCRRHYTCLSISPQPNSLCTPKTPPTQQRARARTHTLSLSLSLSLSLTHTHTHNACTHIKHAATHAHAAHDTPHSPPTTKPLLPGHESSPVKFKIARQTAWTTTRSISREPARLR